MKIGCCGGLSERAMLNEIGFDFIEMAVGELEPRKRIDVFHEKLKESGQPPIEMYAFNCFVPGDLKLTGPEMDLEKLQGYVENVFKRVDILQGKVVVLGSGGARNVPEGYSREKAKADLIEFLKITADLAEKYGITVAIEHLRQQESNIINTVAAGLEIAEKVDRPESIKVLLDNYHLESENESYQVIKEADERLAHVHLADTGRYYPGSGDYDYDTLFTYLKEIDYRGRLSIECSWEDKEEEAAKALTFLQEKCQEYGL